jgi:prepilin-type N-terminal cleavage/methylation domain-containing protein
VDLAYLSNVSTINCYKKHYTKPVLSKSSLAGFTIVELLVVIVIIGILAAITIISYTGISGRATVAAMQSDLNGAANQLKQYQVINSAYPTTLDCSSTPAANSICLKASNSNTYTYTPNNTTNPPTFSLTETNTNGTAYVITDSTGPTSTVAVTPVNLTFNATSTGSTGTIQTWTVPATGTYTIEAWGAQGGIPLGVSDSNRGLGAKMQGDFALTSGQVIKIVVGQGGTQNTSGNTANGGGAGGGGSFVWINGQTTPLIVAGGGGGGSIINGGVAPYWYGVGGAIGINGLPSYSNVSNNGTAGGDATYSGGAKGWISMIGTLNFNGTANSYGGYGGFGGGGHDVNNDHAGGGGGGYSGGGGGQYGYASGYGNSDGRNGGGGGGSYDSGTNQSNTAGVRTGQGLVTINN